MIYFLAFLLATIATARLTRAIVFDDFPPSQWVRDRWDDKTHDSGWNELFHCGYCMGIWVGLPVTALTVAAIEGWDVFASWQGVILALFAWMGVSYVAGIIVASDWG